MQSLHTLSRINNIPTQQTLFSTSPNQRNDKSINVEFIVKKSSTAEEAKLVGRSNLYRTEKVADKKTAVIQSSMSKVFNFVTNPFSFMVGLYIFAFGANQISDLKDKLFGKKTEKVVKTKEEIEAEQNMPFQVFECERCGMQLRPARGRAEKIFANERFKCARCGSKAGAYFNIDDMNDPRAVARLDRIKREEEASEGDYNDDYEEEGDSADDEDQQ